MISTDFPIVLLMECKKTLPSFFETAVFMFVRYKKALKTNQIIKTPVCMCFGDLLFWVFCKKQRIANEAGSSI